MKQKGDIRLAANQSNSNTKKKTTASSGKKQTAKTTAAKKGKTAQDTSFLQSEAAVLGTFAICVFLFLSNFHICGVIGDVLSQVMLGVFGSIGYVAPLLLFAGMLFYASNKGNIRAVYKMLAVEVLLIVLCGLAQLLFGGGYQEGQTLRELYDERCRLFEQYADVRINEDGLSMGETVEKVLAVLSDIRGEN